LKKARKADSLPGREARGRVVWWLSILAVLSTAGTLAYLKSQPPQVSQRFRRIMSLPGHQAPPLSAAVWVDNDTLLYVQGLGAFTVYRMTLSKGVIVVDKPLTAAVNALHTFDFGGDSTGWGTASPDGKWLILKYCPANDGNTDVVRVISAVDGHTVSVDKFPYTTRLVAWLPDSRHWVEISRHSASTHNIDNHADVKHANASFPALSAGANPDGTYVFEDVDMQYGGNGGAYRATPDGRILVGGTSIDLTTNPVKGTHAVDLMPNVVNPKPQDSFYTTRDPWSCAGYSFSLASGRAAYVMFDGGEYHRKRWVPRWVPLPSKTQYSSWLRDLKGHHVRLLAVGEDGLDQNDLATPAWSPDGKHLLIVFKGAIWEADVR